jgi:hypothetical protein
MSVGWLVCGLNPQTRPALGCGVAASVLLLVRIARLSSDGASRAVGFDGVFIPHTQANQKFQFFDSEPILRSQTISLTAFHIGLTLSHGRVTLEAHFFSRALLLLDFQLPCHARSCARDAATRSNSSKALSSSRTLRT